MEAICNKPMYITNCKVATRIRKTVRSTKKDDLYKLSRKEFISLTFVIITFFIPLAVHILQYGIVD